MLRFNKLEKGGPAAGLEALLVRRRLHQKYLLHILRGQLAGANYYRLPHRPLNDVKKLHAPYCTPN
jgi:hypothetical protein